MLLWGGIVATDCRGLCGHGGGDAAGKLSAFRYERWKSIRQLQLGQKHLPITFELRVNKIPDAGTNANTLGTSNCGPCSVRQVPRKASISDGAGLYLRSEEFKDRLTGFETRIDALQAIHSVALPLAGLFSISGRPGFRRANGIRDGDREQSIW